MANGEKACLQHTRFLHYYDKGKCILKQILHVTSMCLNSFSSLVLMFAFPVIDRAVRSVGLTLYMGFWGLFHVNVLLFVDVNVL